MEVGTPLYVGLLFFEAAQLHGLKQLPGCHGEYSATDEDYTAECVNDTHAQPVIHSIHVPTT